ncbi:MAG: hypothetical protein ACHQ9S_22490 [Candidatus Binatia bacterium]
MKARNDDVPSSFNPYERRYPPHIEEQLRADAKRCRDLRNQIGVAARPAQQEAYERWAAVMDDDMTPRGGRKRT